MGIRATRLGALASFAAVLLLVAAASASAQGRWMPSKMLTDQAAVEPRVSITGSGEGIAAWGVRGPDLTTPGDAVSASIRPPGGQFGEARVISPNDAMFVDMAANDAGAVAIGFRAGSGLSARFRPALGDFAAPVDLPATWGSFVVDGAGNTHVLVLEDERVHTETETFKHVAHHLKVLTHRPDGTVEPPRHVESAYTISGHDIATDAAGNLTVAWRQAGEGEREYPVFAATAAAGSQFGEPRRLETPTYEYVSSSVRLAANRRGDVLAVWGVPAAGAPDHARSFAQVPYTAIRPAGGEFGPTEPIAVPDQRNWGMFQWDQALDEAGNAVLAWSNGHTVSVSYRPVAGGWGPREGLGSYAFQPTVAIDGKGTATIAYVDAENQMAKLRSVVAVRRPRGDGARFGPPAELTRAKYLFAPDSAADPLGNTIVVWSHQERNAWSPERTENGIGSAIWDAKAPSVTDFYLDPLGEGTPGVPEFDFDLSEAASVSVTVERTGRRTLRLGRLKGRAARGDGAVSIDRSLAKKLRTKSSYRATIVARDSSGRSSKPRRLTFRRLKG